MYFDIHGDPVYAAYDISGKRLWLALQEHRRQYILHGASAMRPPNSMLLFEWGYEQGYRFIEADIYITADGIPVLCHDPTINARARNDDGTELTETVAIADSTYEELLQYDFGLSLTNKYPGTRIATLSELLDFCREHDMWIMLDVKDTSRLDIIYNLMVSKKMLDKSVWCVGSAISTLTGMDNSLIIEVEGVIATAVPWASKTRAVIIGSSSYATVFTPEFIANAHAQGFLCCAWTIANNQQTADQMWANGCDFVITNELLNSSIPE